MDTLRKVAQKPKLAKQIELTNNFLNVSVTIGFKNANIIKSNIHKLKRIFCNHDMVGVIPWREVIQRIGCIFKWYVKLA